jgi:hypothetical protein
LWGDERLSIFDAGGGPYDPRTLTQIWDGVTARNPWHAPGYFMLLSGWGRLVGWQPPALRAMSLLFGVLGVACTYRLGRDVASPRVGLAAAAVVGTSAFFVYYLHELRMYTLFVLLTAFTIWVYWRIVTGKRQPSVLLWAGLLVGAVGMLYTHYFAALPLFAIGLYHVLFVKKDRRWWQVVGVMALAGLLFLPWFSSLLAGLGRAASEEAGYVRNSAATTGETLVRLAYLFSNGSLILLAVAGVFALTARGRGVWQTWFFALSVLALVLGVNAVVHVMTLTRTRYLLGLWPLLGMIVALGIIRFGRRLAPLALGAWMVIGVGTSLNPGFINVLIVDGRGYMFPWHIAQTAIAPNTQPGDAVVLNLPDGMDSRVTSRNQTIAEYYLSNLSVRTVINYPLPTNEEQDAVYERTLNFAKQSLRVWVGYEVDKRPQALPRYFSALSADYVSCDTPVVEATFRFDLYARSPICCKPVHDASPLMRFGDGIELMGIAPLPEKAMDTLPVLTGWTTTDSIPPYVYSIALHVLDADGQLVAQSDFGVPPLKFFCQETPIDISGLSPGNYQLEALVYEWESGERLSGEAVTTGARGESLPLGTFEVIE